jgi:hypothetical protein
MEEALVFMAARCQFLDLRRHYRQMESQQTPQGDLVMTHWEVAKFTKNEPTVRWIFDEMLEFARTSEMAIAEKLGLVGVRESDTCSDRVDATIIRSVTAHPSNFMVEKNVVVYAQYFSKSAVLDQPHGLLLFDYVDQDDAYPYRPLERIRKDVCSVVLVVECPSSEGSPRSVAVVHWGFKRTHHSPLATEEELYGIAREGPRSYFEVMLHETRRSKVM